MRPTWSSRRSPLGDEGGDLPLFGGKTMRDGRATAYVCRGYACDEPTSDPDLVADQVRGMQQSA